MRQWVAVLILAFGVGVQAQQVRHNVIIFVADGLRRGSVNVTDMPAFMKVRANGVDFPNSHSVFPTFTTANASAIATGHGLGDTGDYSNTIWSGAWMTQPSEPVPTGTIVPFLENDELLVDMNAAFSGNYLGERTLLNVAREHGYSVASVGKVGPTGIQQVESLTWKNGKLDTNGAIVFDDATGHANGFPLPERIMNALKMAGIPPEAPTRTNGFADTSQFSNGFEGDAKIPGTLAPNRVQQQWLADVATRILLPTFVAEKKPFVLLFWSRDPDATQHNEGDSLQKLTPGINGETPPRALRNADHSLQQLLDWLNAHPEIKANTDVVITSDHGFATISRREIASDGTQTQTASALRSYEPVGKEKAQRKGTLPTGFLSLDIAHAEHLRIFDPSLPAKNGNNAYEEIGAAHHPAKGSALLGESVKKLDGSDAQIIVAANGGSDLVYFPSGDAELVHRTLKVIAQMDYVGALFVDDRFCSKAEDCPGALPLSAIGVTGASKVPHPGMVVSFKNFALHAGDLQSAIQVSDTTLQEGQGMHGGFGREQTLNNMAAMGPDFKRGFVDLEPMGNVDIVPTLARVLGFEMPSVGTLKGRVLEESLMRGKPAAKTGELTKISAPTTNGLRTLLEYQVKDGVAYYDRACLVKDAAATHCN